MLVYMLAIRAEEKYLEDLFGDKYIAYKNRVSRWP